MNDEHKKAELPTEADRRTMIRAEALGGITYELLRQINDDPVVGRFRSRSFEMHPDPEQDKSGIWLDAKDVLDLRGYLTSLQIHQHRIEGTNDYKSKCTAE